MADLNLLNLTDAQVFDLAEPVWEALKEASNAVDYVAFSRLFSEDLKSLVTQERFEGQCQELPLLTSLGESAPLACVRRKEGITVIFLQLSDALEGEFVGQLTLAGTEGNYEVINVQVY